MDTQSAAGFGSQLCYMVSPGEVVTVVDDANKFKALILSQWLITDILLVDTSLN